ncbi:DNA primase [Streptomyces sp. NPDC046862]|uniref:DNA primase n=1 Tax=Streptomyces sp. NPDC046862 TaxID=3154603 RepID=UPI0034538687
MNRVGLGLAVGAGYVLGRTKKMKLAFALGTLAAGKRMNLSPRALADMVSQQLQNNPQFKEMGDQLREEMRGAGKAASGALLERQIEGLAGRLHGRTAQVRDRLAGVTPDVPGTEASDDEASGEEREEEPAEEPEEEPSARKAPAKKAAAGQPVKKAAKKAPAKKAAAKKAPGRPAKKAPAKKAASAKPAPRKATSDSGRERRRGR